MPYHEKCLTLPFEKRNDLNMKGIERRIYVALMLLMAASSMAAQDRYIYADPVTIEAGGTPRTFQGAAVAQVKVKLF